MPLYCRQRSVATHDGFSLIEVVVGIGVLGMVLGLYGPYQAIFTAARELKQKEASMRIANDQIEILRNLPFASVGLVSGVPAGSIPHVQTIVRDHQTYTVTTTIRNVDDPLDGRIGFVPNDLTPADYRLVEVSVECTSCQNPYPSTLTTYVAPRNLENTSTTGALFVQVFDASGNPVPQAQVHVVNNTVSPTIDITDETPNSGILQIVGTPASNNAYQVTVSKPGYSTDATSAPGSNPTPTKPHATVTVGTLTQPSFSIDLLASLNITSSSSTCTPTPNIDFNLSGAKTIGTSPTTYKYSQNLATNASGILSLPTLEWDTYTFANTDSLFDVVGTIPLVPLSVTPGSSQNLRLIMTPKVTRALQVTVVDTATQLPISGATVRVTKASPAYDTTSTTGKGFINQTNWSGGSGQADYSDTTKYSSSDNNLDVTTTAGQIALVRNAGNYVASGNLTSSTFDTGSPSVFHQIQWLPTTQSVGVGADPVSFQVASNNDNATWDFKGPDGTSSTYYTDPSTTINAVHSGDQYFRYKLFMKTSSSAVTPLVSDISFVYTSDCVPPGQLLFSGLGSGNYSVTVSKTGYTTQVRTVNMGSNYVQSVFSL